ncbi:Abi family protein [Leifsonia sp. McL0607]|uniref:Abi family protein n=1 Tax=Leifsonia sp. McL0607 TaxID=3415672 RepID=UPI003CEC8071
MPEYTKPWLSLEKQVGKLHGRGVEIGSYSSARILLQQVGYYRLTGYLYPFRESETYLDDSGRERIRVLSDYRSGTSLAYAAQLIDYDRKLRMLVLDAVERLEVSLRMQIGYTLGHRSAFAHRDPANFVPTFTAGAIDAEAGEPLSGLGRWLERVQERQCSSDEAFVVHFRERYDDALPIWALTEILELGHLGRLFGALQNDLATTIANAYSVPTKKMFGSWIASVNYVRNVSAHHARLFNRKLVAAPSRPREGHVPLLDHLRDATGPKAEFGVYNALAVMAFLLGVIDPDCDWNQRLASHLSDFPAGALTTADMGVPAGWEKQALWHASQTVRSGAPA